LPPRTNVDLQRLDRDIRSLPTQDVLEQQGRTILDPLGVSSTDQQTLFDGWRRLRDRRHRTSDESSADEHLVDFEDEAGRVGSVAI
jgi:adenine-specific DNA-methyltransferase